MHPMGQDLLKGPCNSQSSVPGDPGGEASSGPGRGDVGGDGGGSDKEVVVEEEEEEEAGV